MKLFAATALFALFAAVSPNSVLAFDCRGVNVSHIVTSSQLDELGSWGVNCVRYPLFNPEEDTDDADEYQAWVDTQILYIDSLVPALNRNGIKLVLEMYSGPGGHTSNSTNGSGHSQQAIFAYPWAQYVFLSTWQKLASHYASESAIGGYEVFNEWQTGKVSAKALKKAGLLPPDDLALQAAIAIRQLDAVHPIIVDAEYGNPTLASRLKKVLNSGIPGLVISAHIYAPASFTHQGIYGNPVGVQYPSKKANKKSVMKILRPLVSIGNKVGQTNIFLGEYGVTRFADDASAYRYLVDVTSIVQQYGWADAVVGYGDHGPFDFTLDSNGARSGGLRFQYLKDYLNSR